MIKESATASNSSMKKDTNLYLFFLGTPLEIIERSKLF